MDDQTDVAAEKEDHGRMMCTWFQVKYIVMEILLVLNNLVKKIRTEYGHGAFPNQATIHLIIFMQ